MRRFFFAAVLFLLMAGAAFAGETAGQAAPQSDVPDSGSDAVRAAEPRESQSVQSVSTAKPSDAKPYSFTPLSEFSGGNVSIDPNADVDEATRFSLGGFYGIFADDYSGKKFTYLSYAGLDMQFMFRNDASLFVGVGCFFDGSYLPVEASAEWIVARIRTRSESAYAAPSGGIYDGGFSQAVPDVPARIGDEDVVFFTLGPGFMAHFPLGDENPWKITLRANASFSYTFSDSVLDMYMTLSPGWTRIYADDGTDNAFSMGFMLGLQCRLV